MDVSGQGDPDLPGDWTFMPSEGELMDAPASASRVEGSCVEDLPLDENATNFCREKAMEKEGEKEQAAGGDREGDASAGSRDSDIDIIDEDTDHSIESLNSSAIGNTSASLMGFSEISGAASSYGNQEMPGALDWPDAASVASDTSLPSGLEMQSGVRRYKHVPNTRLNWALTAVAALVAVAAVAFGVGHYYGGSDQSFQQRQLSQGQMQQLQALQEELVNCMNQQNKKKPPKGSPFRNTQVCYQDVEYWKRKFEQLFSENKGLKELLEHSQRNAVMHDPRVDSSGDCSADLPDDLHKLKLDLILNQMQHLQLMKTFNQVKHSERLSREQARKLELENEQLKARLEEEETDDILVQKQLESKVRSLTEENQELQSRLGHESQREAALRSLEHQVQQLLNENDRLKRSMQEQVPSSVTTSRISRLRDTVNRLIIENEDLKAVVARLRYGRPLPVVENTASYSPDKGAEERPRDPQPASKDQLSELLDVLKKQQADSKQWRRLYDELRRNRDSAGSKTVWRKLLVLGQTLFDDMQTGLDRTLESLVDLAKKGSSVASDVKPMVQDLGEKVRRELNRRRVELDGYLHGSGKPVGSISQTMSLLESSIKKVFDAGRKFVSKGQEATGKHAEKLVTKLTKVAQMLSSDWEASSEEAEATTSVPRREEAKHGWRKATDSDEDCQGGSSCSKKNGKLTPQDSAEVKAPSSEKPSIRNKQLLDIEETEEEDWFSTRAKNRERQRSSALVGTENWYLKRQTPGWRKGSKDVVYKGSANRFKKESLFWDHESLLNDEEGFTE
uniref:Putative myosin-2 heavy chain non muscle n=1 Tax=Hyalomma excavatum TaxID=257692 RepID=A0A131XJG6_9ACAR